MASKQQVKNVNVICDNCGKTIAPTEAAIPTEYVWYDGKSICWECIRNGATNKTLTKNKTKNPIAQ